MFLLETSNYNVVKYIKVNAVFAGKTFEFVY